jgi:hypothetical protein
MVVLHYVGGTLDPSDRFQHFFSMARDFSVVMHPKGIC